MTAPNAVLTLRLRMDFVERVCHGLQLATDFVESEAVHKETMGDKVKGDLLRDLSKSIAEDLVTLQTLRRLAETTGGLTHGE